MDSNLPNFDSGVLKKLTDSFESEHTEKSGLLGKRQAGHSYLKIVNNELLVTHDKTTRSSLQDINEIVSKILKNPLNYKPEDIEVVKKCYETILDNYKKKVPKANTLARFFFRILAEKQFFKVDNALRDSTSVLKEFAKVEEARKIVPQKKIAENPAQQKLSTPQKILEQGTKALKEASKPTVPQKTAAVVEKQDIPIVPKEITPAKAKEPLEQPQPAAVQPKAKKLESPQKLVVEPQFQFEESDKEDELIAQPHESSPESGVRSRAMRSFLTRFATYSPLRRELTITTTATKRTAKYTPISASLEDISKKTVVSCGSAESREVCMLDPENSPVLNGFYKKLTNEIDKRGLRGELAEEQILLLVKNFIRAEVFKVEGNVVDALNTFLKTNEPAAKLPLKGKASQNVDVFSLDQLVESRVGVCRHHALVAAYFLDKLVKEERLAGKVQHMRDNVHPPGSTPGGHVWATFMSASGAKWHLDSLWNQLEDFSKPKKASKLEKLYGKQVIDQQKIRTAKKYADAIRSKQPLEKISVKSPPKSTPEATRVEEPDKSLPPKSTPEATRVLKEPGESLPMERPQKMTPELQIVAKKVLKAIALGGKVCESPLEALESIKDMSNGSFAVYFHEKGSISFFQRLGDEFVQYVIPKEADFEKRLSELMELSLSKSKEGQTAVFPAKTIDFCLQASKLGIHFSNSQADAEDALGKYPSQNFAAYEEDGQKYLLLSGYYVTKLLTRPDFDGIIADYRVHGSNIVSGALQNALIKVKIPEKDWETQLPKIMKSLQEKDILPEGVKSSTIVSTQWKKKNVPQTS